MAETPHLNRIEDLPLRKKLTLLLIIAAVLGVVIVLAMSSEKTKATGESLLFLIAMPVAAAKFVACMVLSWRSGGRLLAMLCGLLGLLFALLTFAALSWFLEALALAATL